MANSILVQKLTALDIKPYPRSQANLSWKPISILAISKFKDHQIKFWVSRSISLNDSKTKRKSLAIHANSPGDAPFPSTPPPPPRSLKGWILGILMSLILPFFGNKWGPLSEIKNRIENTVQTVENIAEAVEKVAGEVDKIADEISDDLPAGKLKDLMDLVEDVAEKTAKTADSLDNIIDKVQETEDQLEEVVESMVKVKSSSNKPKDK